MEIRTIGIDLGKTVFHFVAVNARGQVVVRKKGSRTQLLRFTANLPQCLIGMEACGGAHFLGRALREQGHDVRLMPAQYVKPYVKTNKNDYIDAEAIAEAVDRPRMRYVPIKSEGQLDMQSLHRVRERWVSAEQHWSTRFAVFCWNGASRFGRAAGTPKRHSPC
jgi:transposase